MAKYVKGGKILSLGGGFGIVKGNNPNITDGVHIGPNNKNGLSVNHGEILQQQGNTLRVFSAEPMFGGISPTQLLYGGLAPDKVFAMQEQYKRANRIADDGSRYRDGGQTQPPVKEIDWSGIKTTNNRPYNKDYINYINKKLVAAGYNNNKRASILANIIEESGGDPFIEGPGGYYGLLQWGSDRYKKTNEKDAYKEIDNQLKYLSETIGNTNDKKSWTHGGKGSGYNSFTDSVAAFDSDDLNKSMHGFTWGYVRPAGKQDSYLNRQKVADQLISLEGFKFGGRKQFQTGGEDNILMRVDSEGNLIDSIKPSVVTAKLPAKFNDSQVAAARYAEGYKFGKKVAKSRDKTAPIIASTLIGSAGIASSPLGFLGGVAGERLGNKIGGIPGSIVGGILGGLVGDISPSLISKIKTINNLDTYYTGVPNVVSKRGSFNPNNYEIWASKGKDYARAHITDRGGGEIRKILIDKRNNKIIDYPKPDKGEYFGWRDLPFLYRKNGKFVPTDFVERQGSNYVKNIGDEKTLTLVQGGIQESTDNIVTKVIKDGKDGIRFYDIGDGASLTKDDFEYWSPIDELVIKNTTKHYNLPENKSKWSLLFKKLKFGGQTNINSLGERPNAKYGKQMKNKRNKAERGGIQSIGGYNFPKPFIDRYGNTIGIDGTISKLAVPSINTRLANPPKINSVGGSTTGGGLSATGMGLIGAGINSIGAIAGSLIQQNAINNLKAPVRQYTLLDPVKLKTKINIAPQIAQMKEMRAKLQDAAIRTSGSSRNAYSRILAGHNNLLQSAMNLYGQKENIETELINRDLLNQQQTRQANAKNVIDTVNYNNEASTELGNRKQIATSNNWTSALNTISGAWAGPNGFIDRENARRVKAGELYVQALANPTAAKLLYGDFDISTEKGRNLLKKDIWNSLNNYRLG